MSISWLLFSFLLGHIGLPGAVPLPAAATTPTSGSVETRLVLQVQLRTAAGAPVPGLSVTLQPAPPDLGGPPLHTSVQRGRTDANGTVTFTALGPWIWRVTFMGTYAGGPLQAVAAQGRPPYGTTPGDGFVVRVQAQEEHVALQAEGQPRTPPIEVAAFVLLLQGPEWIPTIDLSEPTDPPQPLLTPAAAATRTVQSAGAPVRDPVTDGVGVRFDPFGVSLWVLPLLVAGIALWRAWQRQRSERAALAADGAMTTLQEGATDDHPL